MKKKWTNYVLIYIVFAVLVIVAKGKLSYESLFSQEFCEGIEKIYFYDFNEEVYEITTEPSDFATVSEKLQEEGLSFLEASVQQVPSTTVSLDEQAAQKMQRLIDSLEDLDDVMNVYHNWEE